MSSFTGSDENVSPIVVTLLLRPGTRGWLLMEVRSGQPLRAWDKGGRSAALTDWNTLSIDGLYDNLELVAERDAEVQIVFERRWHFPTYIRTSGARVPDAWSITEAQGFLPFTVLPARSG